MVQTQWCLLSLALLARVLLHSLTATCSALTRKKALALLLDVEFGRVVHSHLHRMVQTHWFLLSFALLVHVLAPVFSFSRRRIIGLSLLHSLTATCSALTKKKALAHLLETRVWQGSAFTPSSHGSDALVFTLSCIDCSCTHSCFLLLPLNDRSFAPPFADCDMPAAR